MQYSENNCPQLFFFTCGVHHRGKSLTNAIKTVFRLPFERESWQPDCVDVKLNRTPKVTRHNFHCVIGFGEGLFLISRIFFLEVVSDSARHST